MRTLIAVVGLEFYVFFLAMLRLRGGVLTDEAKYLLDIPYPHPPAARGLFHLLEGWQYQELFWRLTLATLLVQAIWIVWSMARVLPPRDRLAVCAVWLLSLPLLLQAGTIMLAPLTALEGLFFVWLYLRRDVDITRYAGWLAIVWALSLFTAFQAMLYLPLVIALFHRARLPQWFKVFCILTPALILVLYVASQPLIAASFLLVRGDNAGWTMMQRLTGVLLLWGMAGSIWASLLGIGGILSRQAGALLWTFLLLSAYAALSFHEYYAVLFLPVLIAGVVLLLRRSSLPPVIVIVPFLLGTVFFARGIFSVSANPARTVMQATMQHTATGSVLIAGPFGHEWQYESRLPLRRYRQEFLSEGAVRAVVCLAPCREVHERPGWIRLSNAPVGVWVRR